jgi:hypothetical protein
VCGFVQHVLSRTSVCGVVQPRAVSPSPRSVRRRRAAPGDCVCRLCGGCGLAPGAGRVLAVILVQGAGRGRSYPVGGSAPHDLERRRRTPAPRARPPGRRRAAAPSAASGAAAPRPRPVPRVQPAAASRVAQPAAASRAAQPAAAPRPPRKAAARANGNTTDMLSATTRAAVGVPTAAARRVMGHGATAIPQASRRLPASCLPIARAGTSAPNGVARGRSNAAARPTTAAVGVQQRHATPARYEPADETPESTLPAHHSPARHSSAVRTSSASREMRSPEMLEHEFMHELHSPILDKCLPLPPSSLEA